MFDIIFYALAGLGAMALVFGLRWLAARHADGVKAEAQDRIGDQLGKSPDFVHAYGATGFGLDYEARKLVIYDRKTGIETYDVDAIGTWFAGIVTQEMLSPQAARALSTDEGSVSARQTNTRYAIICDAAHKRICQVGILDERQQDAVAEALERLLPGKRNFEAAGAKLVSELIRGER